MRHTLYAACMIACGACRPAAGPYLFVWAGDSAGKASDFLAVIDANAASSTYGAIVASIPTGVSGTHPHHTAVTFKRWMGTDKSTRLGGRDFRAEDQQPGARKHFPLKRDKGGPICSAAFVRPQAILFQTLPRMKFSVVAPGHQSGTN